jgi:hypothetical protein
VLNQYLTQLQTILHDFSGTLYGTPLSQTAIINQARRRVAIQGQCVRVLPPITGVISSIAVTSPGSGYTAPVVSFTDTTGTGAAATATEVGGAITAIAVTLGGSNYSQPNVVITDPTAVAQATIAAVQTVQAQESYSFSTYNTYVQQTSGVKSIFQVVSVAISQGTTKPMMRYMDWSSFQAFCRINQNTIQNYPAIWSQYQPGDNGSLYLFPIPSGNYQMDWDCLCLPLDLVDDTTPEAIPYPFTEAVPYYAAYLCYQYAQRGDDAQRMLSEYRRLMIEGRGTSTTTRIPDIYDEDIY